MGTKGSWGNTGTPVQFDMNNKKSLAFSTVCSDAGAGWVVSLPFLLLLLLLISCH